MTDLRMGSDPNYVFQFKVAEFENGKIIPVQAKNLSLFVTGANCLGYGKEFGKRKTNLNSPKSLLKNFR